MSIADHAVDAASCQQQCRKTAAQSFKGDILQKPDHPVHAGGERTQDKAPELIVGGDAPVEVSRTQELKARVLFDNSVCPVRHAVHQAGRGHHADLARVYAIEHDLAPGARHRLNLDHTFAQHEEPRTGVTGAEQRLASAHHHIQCMWTAPAR